MRRALTLAAALALASVLAGCAVAGGGSSPTPVVTATGSLEGAVPLPDPAHATGPVTAAIPDGALVPIDDPAAPSLPVEVVSHDPGGDRQVEVTDASRLLALDISGSLAATVWGLGLGDLLVGRDMSTTFAQAADLPVVTSGAHAIDAESVLALRPTLLLTDGTIGPRDVVEQLRASGVTVVFLPAEPSLAGASDLARVVGEALGVPESGARLAERIDQQVAAIRAQIDALAPPVDRPRIVFLYLRGDAGVYYLFGEGSGADDLIRALHGVDVAAELDWQGERPMTDEALVAAAPDVILVMTDGLASVGGIDGLLAAKPAVALTPAGERRRIIDMADGVVLGFGPRSPEVLEALARALYTEPGS
ncbi:MAG: ABC transporter substrate-binding protein [Actinomycetales bacterium]|nr:ABC transporter substrate-binding protein [Actinomycetales bacterium]